MMNRRTLTLSAAAALATAGLPAAAKTVDYLGVPRRSTLIVLKGDKELGRIVADTSKSSIKALMDTALTAATQS